MNGQLRFQAGLGSDHSDCGLRDALIDCPSHPVAGGLYEAPGVTYCASPEAIFVQRRI
jgi:hypothetical protein